MKVSKIPSSCILLGMCVFSSCIQDEPLNSEADILCCDLREDEDVLITKGDTMMEVTSIMNLITISVSADCDLTQRAPKFILSDGATISPASGSVHDFSDNKVVTYTVTSESGEYSRTYKVAYYEIIPLPKHFDFEHYMMNENNKYHVFYETVGGIDVLSWWSSGNPGYTLAASKALPEDYPTASVVDGYKGRGLQLTTCYAGSFGKAAGMPIAAGNLFLGTFNVQQALKSPLSATRFGVTFNAVPDSIVGWYKYKAGEQMTDRKYKNIDGKDEFNIYAFLYENTDENGNAVMLDGTNSSSSEYIVLYAQIDEADRVESDEWRRFSIAFEPRNGKSIDPIRLSQYGYNFSIVFSASIKGDDFSGAVGSRLMIDEVDIICK